MMHRIRITNTLTGKKELFKPFEQGKVTMYVCGVTPYDFAHLGHGRCYVAFDLLYRLLQFLTFEVRYCRNFTDIDDKILHKAHKELGNETRYPEITQKYIASFHEDMAALNCLSPDYEPRVTENMPIIVAFIMGLINAGKAYVSNGDIYFHIPNFPDYGKLSKHKLEDLRAGARVDVSEKKKDPLDFVLWKGAPEGQFWESPWGYGRPGWHIECSALAAHYLGKQIDIHAGGMDLIFPHHENEIAQSEGLYKVPFVHYWVHNGFVRIDQEKMSKSLGNVFMLRDIFTHFDPMVVRFYLLNHHYRAPLDFSFDDLQAIQKSYQRLCSVFAAHTCTQQHSQEELQKLPIIQDMLDFLCDDLNTPGMWGVLFEQLGSLQKDEHGLCMVKLFINQVLGVTLEPLPAEEVEITPEIQKLLQERERARQEKDWARADAIRDQLVKMGIDVRDEKIRK